MTSSSLTATKLVPVQPLAHHVYRITLKAALHTLGALSQPAS